jgi:hypothetical protein
VTRAPGDALSLRGKSGTAAEARSHAAMRWAHLVAAVVRSPVDLRTLEAWGRHAAVSRSAMKVRCGGAGAPARRSLLLGRLLRAVQHRRHGMSFQISMDIRDRRTFRKLFEVAGHPDANDDWHRVVAKQHFVDDANLLAALTHVLGERHHNP